MQTTTIIARDSRAALDEIARQLGPDALVLETRRHPRGVEVLAGIEGPRGDARRCHPHLTSPIEGGGTRLSDSGGASPPLRWGGTGRGDTAGHPATPFATFAEQARDIGFDSDLLDRVDRTGLAEPTEAWSRFLALLDSEVAIAPPPHLGARHVCVVGGSGTGKTTVLAQIAARLRRDDPGANIAFLSADAQRIGAREQLRLIGGKLGVPVFEAGEGGLVAGACRLLIDMPSDPWTARRLAEPLRELPGGVTTLCTLPLTAQRARHRQMLDHFDGLTDALAVTHAGDSLPPGALISALAAARQPLAYLSRDADPLAAIEPARSSALYRLIVAALSGASPALH